VVKSQLIAQLIAAHPHLPPQDVLGMVERLFELMSESLKRGDRVEIRGFGSFRLGSRASRRMVDPRSGETRNLPARKTILFKPGVWFKAIREGKP